MPPSDSWRRLFEKDPESGSLVVVGTPCVSLSPDGVLLREASGPTDEGVEATAKDDSPPDEARRPPRGFDRTAANAATRGTNVPFEKRNVTNSRPSSSHSSGIGAHARSGASCS